MTILTGGPGDESFDVTLGDGEHIAGDRILQ